MKIEPIMICREYYEKVKHLYPELNFTEFAEICYVPWHYTRKHMASGELKAIRLKYFGLFSVLPGKIIGEMKHLETGFRKGYINEKRYLELKKIYNNYKDNGYKKNNK